MRYNSVTKGMLMAPESKRKKALYPANVRLAKLKWNAVNPSALAQLKKLSNELHLSVASGDLLLLNANWYVTHTGLIRLAARRRCRGIELQPIPEFSDARFTARVSATRISAPRTRSETLEGSASPYPTKPGVSRDLHTVALNAYRRLGG